MDSCYLCGSRKVKYTVYGVGDNSDLDWLMGGLKEGKTRVTIFSLCQGCFRLPDKERLIEEKMESDAKMRRGYSVKSIK